MQFFYWIVLLIAVGLAVFAVQNSSAPPVTIRFIFWSLETSLVYTILASIGLGIVLTLLIWIPSSIRSAFRRRRGAGEVHEQSSNVSRN